MSRRRTKAEEIRNPEHYFNRYIACERKKEQEENERQYKIVSGDLEDTRKTYEKIKEKNGKLCPPIKPGKAGRPVTSFEGLPV